jgi:hypothetical protein
MTDARKDFVEWVCAHKASILDGMTRREQADFTELFGNLRADLATPPAGQVTVKPLSWATGDGGCSGRAETPFGPYWYGDGRNFEKPELWYWAFNGEDGHRFTRLVEAKAAAQTDYKARILSALTPPAGQATDSRIADYEAAHSYALQLADALHHLHYPEVTQWRPLSDPLDLLKQIDNMVAALTLSPTPVDASAGTDPIAKALELPQIIELLRVLQWAQSCVPYPSACHTAIVRVRAALTTPEGKTK